MEQLRGLSIVDVNDERIGTVEDLYFDEESRRPQWLLVESGRFGRKQAFVPAVGVTREGDALKLPFDKAQVQNAPRVEPDGDLLLEEEKELYSHYGLRYSTEESATGLPEQGASADPEAWAPGGGEVIRSEEELRLRTARRPAELVRLRKYVVREPVSETVAVERDDVRMEREPITADSVAGRTATIGEDEQEIVVMEEQVVAEKRVVPKERVRLAKETTTEQQEIKTELAREQIEFERGDTRVLDDVPGLGPERKARLLTELGGIAAVRSACLEDLQALSWLPENVAVVLHEKMRSPGTS